MFKKSFKIQNTNQLKASDKKKLRQHIIQCFPHLQQVESEILDELCPIKGDMQLVKISGSKTCFYVVSGKPMFFDVDARGTLFPTVYALWIVPDMLRSFEVHAPVFQYIASGADLMLPGVQEESLKNVGTFLKKAKFAVRITGNRAPIAVGYTLVSSKDIEENGMKGKGLEVLHYFQDFLWECGPKESLPLILDKEEANEMMENHDPEKKQSEQEPSEVSENNEHTKESEVTPDNKEETKESQDELLNYCFLAAIKKTKDKDLPVLVSNFYSNTMMSYKPLDVVLDVKKSSFKKVSNFLEEMQKQGFIDVTTEKGVSHIVSIYRDHPEYVSFKPKPTEEELNENISSKPEKLSIVEFFKPHATFLPLFIEMGFSKDHLFTMPEVRKILADYISKHQLTFEKDSSKIALNDILIQNFFKKKAIGELVTKKELNEKIAQRLSPYHQIIREGVSELRKGELKNITIKVLNRQGGKKHVTHISGLENFGISPEVIAKDFSKAVAASATVQELEGKNGEKEVLIQGDVAKKVSQHLTSVECVPNKYISVSASQQKNKKK